MCFKGLLAPKPSTNRLAVLMREAFATRPKLISF